MTTAFGIPPQPVYPFGIDSDYTLFLVYNTSEAQLTQDNEPWGETIELVPVPADRPEIWADNGFANIEGELLYYDAVDKDANGKVFRLKRCARNLGGKRTKHNKAGTWVRGFVIAEHHNQLAEAIIQIENFVGINFDPRPETLDFRIRCLHALPVIFDDFGCPDITFQFDILSTDPAGGTLAQYFIQSTGALGDFRLDFGDGQFTTSPTNGQHQYAPNATIDPVIQVSTDSCAIVQTPYARTNPQPPPEIPPTPPFEIPLPECPAIPDIVIPNVTLPSVIIAPPPIQLPCIDLTPIGPINIPSVIMFEPPFPLPSVITITPVNIPSVITITPPGPIQFAPAPQISPVGFGPAPTFSPISISPVGFGPAPTFSPINLTPIINFGPIQLSFGPLPGFPVVQFAPTMVGVSIAAFVDVQVTMGPTDIPSEIFLIAPPNFDLPSEILIDMGPGFVQIPSQVLFGPVQNIPSLIQFGPVCCLPSLIQFGPVCCMPSMIQFGPVSVPSVISFAPINIPSIIEFGPAPTVNVNWSPVPTLSCIVTVQCPNPNPPSVSAFAMDGGFGFAGDDFGDLEAQSVLGVDAMALGIPTEIKILPPELPDIRVIHDIPVIIDVQAPKIPDIKIIGPEKPIPTQVTIVHDIPSSIQLEGINIPTLIRLETPEIPSVIKLDMPKEMPSIRLDTSGIPDTIRFVGAPSTIELVGPSTIQLVMPENPQVEMVYRGNPIDVKIHLDISKLTGEGDEDGPPCVAIVPCPRK
jgi:hypothetical protein